MRTGRALALTLVALSLSACGGEGGAESAQQKSAEQSLGKAADASTCVADAKAVSGSTPAGYAKDFPLPSGTVMFSVQDRGATGVVGTGVVKASLKDVLATLNGTAQDAGYTITTGETEKHDAEANWSGNGFRGRWAIKESATCSGEIVIQVLSAKS